MIEDMEKDTDSKVSLTESFHDIEERYRSTRDELYALNRQALVVIEKHPAACIAGAFAVGWLIGKLAKKRWLI